MIKSAFRRQNLLFTLAVMGLVILSLLAVGMFGAVTLRIRESRHAYEETRREFYRQYNLWEQQNITRYTVTYTNCNFQFCCTREQLTVTGDTVQAASSTCATTGYGYGDYAVYSMDDFYDWLAQEYSYNNSRNYQIEYHPELHYITRLRWIPYKGANERVIEYTNLIEDN